MSIPDLNDSGDLPVGVHQASLYDVLERFGQGTPQRQLVTQRLKRVYELANRTGGVERFIIFGSYVTAKPSPNDVDIILVMRDGFALTDCDDENEPLFDHLRAQQVFGASVFWIYTFSVLLETVDEFIASWQIKRDGGQRGIIEVDLEAKE
jgi:predicted nucleotidyltransferase